MPLAPILRSHRAILPLAFLMLASIVADAAGQDAAAAYDVRSARSGAWSDPSTWSPRAPQAGDRVQVRAGHEIVFDAMIEQPLRMVHVAGTLRFSRDHDTLLTAGLVRVQPGDSASESGFDCSIEASPARRQHHGHEAAIPLLEIGAAEAPIPTGVTATVRLAAIEDMDPETLPAVVACGGRWEVHGAPMNRTWIKLAEDAAAGASTVALTEPPSGWSTGDRIIVTASHEADGYGTFRPGEGRRSRTPQTEERTIAAIDGPVITLDRPLEFEHFGRDETRSEVANLSRNVIIESADPGGVRGHTMFHQGSAGGISYAEFRHLGKEGVLGKYPIHFHLAGDSMRGASIVGASIHDSHNRWITIHGTDGILVRDCVGYRSVGHGFFLEDGTEQWNILDRNLAVQAFRGKRLPNQALPFDPNDGAGFWWANGNNALVRNVACENDEYGFRFEVTKSSGFDPVLELRHPDGSTSDTDIRTIPFLKFEANESHSEGLYSFNFGDDRNGSVRGDRGHPFIVRDLLAWETHYAMRPNIRFFLAEGLRVRGAAYGVYHPDYDSHVYRDIDLARVNAEPVNRGHDDESIQFGDFTYERLTIRECRPGRDPLIQLACTAPNPGVQGHFRDVRLIDSESRHSKVVDLGGGPRNGDLEFPVTYHFHGWPDPDKTTSVMSKAFGETSRAGFGGIDEFTGPDAGGLERGAGEVAFPELLAPVDDRAPFTLVRSVRPLADGTLAVSGTTVDDGEIASVEVGGVEASITATAPGIADWAAEIPAPNPGSGMTAIRAAATDAAGNREIHGHAQSVSLSARAARIAVAGGSP